MPSSSRGSRPNRALRHKCTCAGDIESTYSRDDDRSATPSSRSRTPPRRNRRGGKKERRGCTPFLLIFSILNLILILLGLGLAAVAFYTSRKGNPYIEDLRTFEYEYHLKGLMYAIGVGGIIAAITGVVGLVVVCRKAVNSSLRVAYEIMLLISAALLLILGTLVLFAIAIRKNNVDDHLRPIMRAYDHEDNPDPFKTIHRFQAEFRCCGLSTPPDPYIHLRGTAKGPLPWSCCYSFYSDVLQDPVVVQRLVDEAQRTYCTRAAPGTHTTFCDRLNPVLARWGFLVGIGALIVSLYCILLLVISCIARRTAGYEERE